MKKLFVSIMALALAVSCSKNDDLVYTDQNSAELVLTGLSGVETRTHFGDPDGSQIPYFWSKGDYIWLGSVKSQAVTEDCRQAQFRFSNPPSTIGDYHIFYNMTGEHKKARILAEQSADGNLGNDGDFGYAVADEFGAFCIAHKTSYIWFDTKASGKLPELLSITVTAQENLFLAGDCEYDYKVGQWKSSVSNGTNQIVLDFGDGVSLKSSNDGVFAAIVTLPAKIGGTQLTVTYTFADGGTFTEVKNPSKDLVAGDTQRIRTTIAADDIVYPESEPDYVLRVLTFEDADAKFEPYSLDYAGADIYTWSDLIDEPQYNGPLTYGDFMTAAYTWWDENNTNLYHMFPDNYAYCFWGGGHAISNYKGAGYSDEDRDNHIAKYYGQDYVDMWAGQPGADAALGWFLLQFMTPMGAHSGDNFAVHYGYKDHYSYIENLPELSFEDGEARVIDHMYVTNTNYTLNQLYNGVKSEEGNSFGGNWTGLTEDAWLKIVAYGFESIDDDEYTTETEFYLVKGMNVVEDWQKWDLSVLGKVAKVQLNFLYSDEMGGSYGFTIPGYFAYDDIAVRFEK